MQFIPLGAFRNSGIPERFQVELGQSSAVNGVDTPESEGRAALQFAYPADEHKIFVPHSEPAAVKLPARAGK
jgi:hypothetical protein